MVDADRFARQRGAPYALPELHGGKRGAATLLCRVRGVAPLALPSLRFRERAHCEVLRRLRKNLLGAPLLRLRQPRRPHLAPMPLNAASFTVMFCDLVG